MGYRYSERVRVGVEKLLDLVPLSTPEGPEMTMGRGRGSGGATGGGVSRDLGFWYGWYEDVQEIILRDDQGYHINRCHAFLVRYCRC